jgi:LuxR family maltose regulon positive regulatory protein
MSMQQVPILQTKLYIPPIRAELVSRPRLVERLNAGLGQNQGFGHKLTVISAPAGFGKTTLLTQWLNSAQCPSTWLSLDESDNDATRFLTYFVAALRTIEAHIGRGVLSALQSPRSPPAEAILTSLINDVAALPDGMILVLDDYHLIEAQAIHDALTFLLEHLPPQMHLVIATREDPPLPLARLRARGQLTELRAKDLRFTSSEAAEFLNTVMGLSLSAKNIASLETRTEGWIAGLQLAAISIQGRKDASSLIRSFTGSHRYVLDYLIEEVLEQQSASIQTFLLQTSILDRLTGSLCDVLTDQGNGQSILEALERANLFIAPLDDERCWYRYHHLFADLLRQRLRQTQPEHLPILHLRASEWYEQNGFIDEAIEHALRGKDVERAASLIENQANVVWERGEHTKLWHWLARLPEEAIFQKPLLCVFHAWFLFVKGPRDAAERFLQAAEQVIDSSTDAVAETRLPEQVPLSNSERQRLRGRAAVIRAFMATFQGDVPAIIENSRQALEYLPQQDLTWRSTAAIALGDALGFKGDMVAAYKARLEAAEASAAAGSTVFSILAYIKVAITLREQGQLQRTIEICQQQVQLAGKSGLSRGSMAGCLLAIWGEALAELGDLEGALAQARRGMEQAERGGDWSLFGWSCLCLMRVLVSRGDLSAAKELVQKLENTAREFSLPPWITNQMAAWQTRLWIAQDKLEAASQWVEARGLQSADELDLLPPMDYFLFIEYVLLARIMIAQGRLAEATRLLPRLLETAEAGDRRTRVIEILNLQALAFQAGGNTTQAMTALERALDLAEPKGYIRIFVDEGPLMARLLYKALTRDIAPDYVHKLLAAFPDVEPERTDLLQTQASESELVEPLSERELQVLQLIAEGLTNREIATRLFLSLNTVKVHTRNIYGKLGVRSRTQAVARATALGILPSI